MRLVLTQGVNSAGRLSSAALNLHVDKVACCTASRRRVHVSILVEVQMRERAIDAVNLRDVPLTCVARFDVIGVSHMLQETKAECYDARSHKCCSSCVNINVLFNKKPIKIV